MRSKKCVLAGAAGYIAPKHFEAIRQNGGEVLAVIDPVDHLDVLDNYFPDAEYFRSLDEAKSFLSDRRIDYFVICSPSHLHAKQICFALEMGCDVVCESPVVLSPEELDQVKEAEQAFQKKVFTILQYRYDPAIRQLKQHFRPENQYKIELVNNSFRGKWLAKSWKGDEMKTGGILTVLGYHFFDALMWIYGSAQKVEFREKTAQKAAGSAELDHAQVDFAFSNADSTKTEKNILQLVVGKQAINLSHHDQELYNQVYRDIFAGNGIELKDVEPTIRFYSS